MPALFIKIAQKLTISNRENAAPVVPNFTNLSSIGVSVSIYQPDSPQIKFTLNSEELESGYITGKVVGDKVEIDVDAIAKINVKPAYADEFLDPATRWEFLSIDGTVADIDGLETESYEEYNRFHDKTYTFHRYFIPVSTSKKAKDLS